MASAAVRAAFWSRLTGVSTAESVPLLDTENKAPVVKDLPDHWFTLDYIPEDERPASIGTPGSRLFRESGEVEVSVVVKKNTGVAVAVATAEKIRDSLRDAHFDGVFIRSVSPPDISDAFGDGNWHRASVPVSYDFDSYR